MQRDEPETGTSAWSDLDSTFRLLERARAGDRQALDRLFDRYTPALRRWAKGRLPRWARDLADTPDLVQDTVLEVFKRIETFEPRGDGAFQAYLRQALMNRIRNELRRVATKPSLTELDSKVEDPGTSPLEAAIGTQAADRYEAALARLKPAEREAVITRVELGRTYPEVAEALGKPSPNAAWMAVSRALLRLAEEMERQHE